MAEALSLPFSGTSPISRHRSSQAAQHAAQKRGRRTREYLALLKEIGARGVSDHDAARMLGLPLSSINSIRNGCGDLVVATDRKCMSPFGRPVTAWRIV
jgi:hypothetical protein